ncbi:CHAT domain-containing protein [Dokdonia sp. Hel_I_53]|uniref:CHAT domain-containing protein n=1 Tax=Dokdonia sp. Hel_I_53 TaxID=1566287 RepID=UPI00119C3A85|nr:CHAT domain-containing protein [Dokdonia sp. Hel_I_53]TVZ52117.1 CHAT domain-containing protein [Dokdonia sp. Hel_I_53]
MCKDFNSYFKNSNQILNNPKGYSKIASNLYRFLKVPKTTKLIISPESILNFIPFSALLTSNDESVQLRKKPYLIKESKVTYIQSTHLYLTEDNHLKRDLSVLGIFPVFENTDRALTHSIKEANKIDTHTNLTTLMNSQATRAAFLLEAEKFDILHLSTHANSGNFSIPASLSFYDQDITVSHIYGEQWSPDLVVLSACETGVGKLIYGEGSQSLARAFHYAGAKNILFSQWKVNDLSTSVLMGDYYKNLIKTKSRDISLQKAQLSYLSNTSISDSRMSPYYWASFVYYGTTDTPKHLENNWWLWGAIFIILFLLFIIIKKYAFTSRVSSI